jgi:hypothetical protein
MATVASWARFHYAVRDRGGSNITSSQSMKWIIQPAKPSISDDPDTPDDESYPGQKEISVFVNPIQHKALSVSAPRGNIPVY